MALQRFAAVIMRIREPKTTALIFASGKMVSSPKSFWCPTCWKLYDFIPDFLFNCCFSNIFGNTVKFFIPYSYIIGWNQLLGAIQTWICLFGYIFGIPHTQTCEISCPVWVLWSMHNLNLKFTNFDAQDQFWDGVIFVGVLFYWWGIACVCTSIGTVLLAWFWNHMYVVA